MLQATGQQWIRSHADDKHLHTDISSHKSQWDCDASDLITVHNIASPYLERGRG